MTIRVLSIAAAAAFFCAISASAQNEPICSVRGTMGTVKVLTGRDRNANPSDPSTWPDARINMPLREKDRIATLAESEARLETADGSTFRLRENTVIEIETLKGGANAVNARIAVNDGNLVANVIRVAGSVAGNRPSVDIKTATSLASIRGTTVEIESRRAHGTTIKTFDGTVRVAPAGRNQFSNLGDYEMTEVAPGQRRNAAVRAVPRNYRPRTTKLLNEEETAALTGFTRVILTFAELEEIQRKLEADGIPSAIGIGESDNEMTARTISSDAARASLAAAMETQVQRISESYTQNISNEAERIWEEGVRQITNVSVSGSSVHSTITQYNPELRRFKVYSLMLVNPNLLKTALINATDRMDADEAELRVRKDEMIGKLNASIEALNTRYHDR